MPLDYPKVRATDDNPTAELQEDYDLSDPDRTKIKPLKSAKERCDLFDRLTMAEKPN